MSQPTPCAYKGALARGCCASPSNPLPTVAPIRCSRQWTGSSPTTSAPPPSSSMRSVSGRPSPAAPSRQRRWEPSACPTKYVAQSSVCRWAGWRASEPSPQGYIRTGATPPTAGGGWDTRGYTWCHTTLSPSRASGKKGGVAPVLSLSAGAVRVVRSRTRNPNNDSEKATGGVGHPLPCFWYTPPPLRVPFCSTPAVTPIVTPERSSGQLVRQLPGCQSSRPAIGAPTRVDDRSPPP